METSRGGHPDPSLGVGQAGWSKHLSHLSSLGELNFHSTRPADSESARPQLGMHPRALSTVLAGERLPSNLSEIIARQGKGGGRGRCPCVSLLQAGPKPC